MNDDLSSLASRYLDGDADADERAQVDVDPELQAEVARLRMVRAVVADLDEPIISVRERHLAAALDAWDRLPPAERTGRCRRGGGRRARFDVGTIHVTSRRTAPTFPVDHVVGRSGGRTRARTRGRPDPAPRLIQRRLE
jgi:hypothetical protein